MLKSTSFLFFVLLTSVLYSQKISHNLLGNAGGEVQNQNIHIHASVGEPFIGFTMEGSRSILTGFQQMDADMSSSVFTIDGQEVEIILFPNPVLDVLNLRLETEVHISSLTIKVHNLQGRLMHDGFLNGKSDALDISTFPPGMYMMTLINDKGIASTHKFIKS